MKPVLIAVLVGHFVVTSYRSVPSQTKPTNCNWTSIGERCNIHGIAVAQNLLAQNGGPIHYGDLLLIDGVGYRIVNDCMNARIKNQLDAWVETYDDEKAFDRTYRGRKLTVWKVEQQ